MKKLIALSAVAVMASSAAMADVAISGSASVSYDDNGTAASATTYDADITITGTAGGTTLTASYDMEGTELKTTAVDLTTTIGPVTIAADMFDEVSIALDADDTGGPDFESTDTSVTVSLDVPVGDMTIGLDNSGDITLTGTFSGVTIAHTIKDGSDKTVGSASIAGMDISLTNDGGSTTWSIGTTVSGVALTLDSENDVSAAFGLAGNTLTVTHNGERAAVDAVVGTKWNAILVKAYTTVAISRDLTSGATLTATYSSKDDSLTLKAAVSF
jgi:hypothetical protein